MSIQHSIAPRGGTELLLSNLRKYTNEGDWSGINLLLSVCRHELIQPNSINVLWQHLSYDQQNVAGMLDESFTDKIDHHVFVSSWQLRKFRRHFPHMQRRANYTVIRNAIDDIRYLSKPVTGKIRLIYTSMPNRGLSVLLDALDIMNRDDIEVLVFSSNIIYGSGYASAMTGQHDHLFNRCRSTKGVVYMGYAMNAAIRRFLQTSHIFAYPSTFEETSCLAAIEAGAAGCKIVTTDLGALTETCDSRWATFVPYQQDHKSLAEAYAVTLNSAIESYRTDTTIDYYEQSNWYNAAYSWQNRRHEWLEFLKSIQEAGHHGKQTT